MAHEDRTRTTTTRPRGLARLPTGWAGIGAVIALLLGEGVYRGTVPSSLDIVAVELGGAGQPWPLPASTASALRWDFVLIAGYATALLWGCRVAHRLVRGLWLKRIALIGAAVSTVAILSDCTENLLLLAVIGQPDRPATARAGLLDSAAMAATVKFSALVPAALIAVSGLVLLAVRTLGRARGHTAASESRPTQIPPTQRPPRQDSTS